MIILLGFLLNSLQAMAAPKGWTVISNKDGIEVARKEIPNSPLFAFRGEAVVDIDAAILSSVLLNDSIGPEWVDLMFISRRIKRLGPDRKHVHQGYDLPWPIQDRDYSLDQQAKYDAENKEFTLLFKSMQSADLPVQDCCIRAKATKTYWYTKSLPNGKTRVMVEVITDPKGSLPAWLINLIQKDWPYNTISSLKKRAQKGDIIPNKNMTGWHTK